ncbi:MAG: hypothetical protein DMF51_05760, partial [Acidobacteria bacterium]
SQGARLYPIRIDYAAHPATGLPATNAVQICWERRGDESPTPYGERLLYRLSSILTSASGKVARSYAFQYDKPGSTTDIIGSCAPGPAPGPIDGGGPTGPGSPGGRGGGPAKINAAPRPVRPPGDTTSATATSASTTSLPIGESSLVAIVRGDGAGGTLPAIEYSYYLPDGYGHWSAALPGGAPPLPLVYGSSGEDEDPGVRLEDLNRDGLPDLVQFTAHLTGGVYQVTAAVYLNTGSGFVYDAAWSASLMNLVDTVDQSQSAYFVLKRGTLNRVEMGVRFLDVNDDGYPDVVRIAQHYNLGIRKGVFLNTGSGFTTDRSASYLLPDEPFVWLHAESGRDISDDLGVRLADVNADGRADILVSRAEWGAPATRRVYLYDRGVYRLDPGWILPDDPFVRHISHGRFLDMGMRLMELNGDGLVDLFRASNVDGTVQNVAYLNTGRPGGPSPTWTSGGFSWFLEITGGERFVDVYSSGDGASLDRGLRVVNEARLQTSYIILARSWDGVQQRVAYYPILTGGWGHVDFSWFPGLFVVKTPGGAPRDQGVRLIDLDGDGGADYLAAPETGTREWRRNTSWLPGSLMKSYTNGLGGRASLVYAPAPHGGPAEGGARATLPYPVTVVTERSDEDGMGHTYTTRYAYEVPFHNHAGRDFRGFRRVTETGPGGLQSVETLFYQQPDRRVAPLRGVPQERVVRRTADGAVFARTAWTYDTGDAIPPLGHPLVRDETTLYDWTTTDPGSAAYVRRSAVSYAYLFDETVHPPDRMMLRRIERREGSVDDPLDDRVITEDFLSALDDGAGGDPALGRWFFDLPVHRSLAGVDGSVVSESWTFYDGLALGAVGDAGLATREQRRSGPPGPAGRAPDDSVDPAISRGYDVYGNLAWEVDPLGRRRVIVRGQIDPTFTFPDSESDALGRVTSRVFDPRTGLLLRLTDPNGARTQMEYDGFGRKTAEYGPYDSSDRPTVSYRHDYDAVPARVFRFAREQSGAGERQGTAGCLESIAYFDGLGRLLETKIEAPGGRMVVGGAVTFDAAGRMATRAEPFFATGEEYALPSDASFASHTEYDAAGRRTVTVDAAGRTRRVQYAGWDETFLDPLGHRHDLGQNAFGDVVRAEDFEGGAGAWRDGSIAAYVYDAAGRLVRVTDPAGSVTTLAYDTLGQRLALTDAHLGSWRSVYDLAGNLTSETDPSGQVTGLTYDALDRLVRKDLPDGSRFAWGYDEGGAAARAIGRLTSIIDPTGTQRFEHDLMGRVTRMTRALDGATYTVDTAYDAQGRIVLETLPGGPAAEYAYDEGGNLSVARPFATALAYNERGQLTAITLKSGGRLATEYESPSGRPLRLHVVGPGGDSLLDDNYGYDDDDRIARIDDRHDPARPSAQVFTYDGRHRLTRAVGPYGDLAYLYDDAGSLLTKDGVGFFYDDPLHPHWVTRSSTGQSMSYDAAGNIVSIRSASSNRTLTYDATGRLSRLADGMTGLVLSETYDAGGRRVREVTDAPGQPRAVLLTPMPQIEVRDGLATLSYFAGGRRIAMVESSGRTLYPITDHLGSTRAVIDDQGRVVARYDYRPFGRPASLQDDAAITRLFIGAPANRSSNLLLMGSRHYDPELGRFLEPDALVPETADPAALNRYAYARDNPVGLSDPGGRNPLGLILFVGALALMDRDTRADVGTSVALTGITIFLTAAAGPGWEVAMHSLAASKPALYAAAVTPVILHTPLGQGIVDGFMLLFQDLGLAPRSAAMAGSVFSTFLLNSSFQRGFANALAEHGEIHSGQPIAGESALRLDAAEHHPSGELGPPTGDVYGMPIQGYYEGGRWIEPGSLHQLVDSSGKVVGAYGTRQLAGPFEHGAVGFYGEHAAASQPHRLYLLGGVSTQQFARELFREGYSGTLSTLSGRASDFLIEFVYGPYGGGLALGVQAGHDAAAPRIERDP